MKNYLRIYYILSDIFIAFFITYISIDYTIGKSIIYIFFWVFIFYFSGFYNSIYKKSRIKDLLETIFVFPIGILLLYSYNFFSDTSFWPIFINVRYLILHLVSILLFRQLIIYLGKLQLKYKVFSQSIILIINDFSNESVNQVVNNLEIGTNIFGYFSKAKIDKLNNLVYLGGFEEVYEIIKNNNINSAIILSNDEKFKISKIGNLLQFDIIIRFNISISDIFSQNLKTNVITGPLLKNIYPEFMPLWQRNVKITLDFIVSVIILLLISPFVLLLSIVLFIIYKGNIFYSQERIGYKGKKFNIYKFRTMYMDSEANGIPQLSSSNDLRITKIGRWLRKWRIDEIPQFLNVLKGDMSLVGYRAEREYFIQQIIQSAPYYVLLYKAKPGITSFGMVKFGYASNVKEMVERLNYDLIYIENASLIFDLRILIHTILILIQGKGK